MICLYVAKVVRSRTNARNAVGTSVAALLRMQDTAGDTSESDDGRRTPLETALERLCAEVLLHGASLPDDSPAKAAMIRSLESIRENLEENPDWFHDLCADLAPQPGPRDERGDH